MSFYKKKSSKKDRPKYNVLNTYNILGFMALRFSTDHKTQIKNSSFNIINTSSFILIKQMLLLYFIYYRTAVRWFYGCLN